MNGTHEFLNHKNALPVNLDDGMPYILTIKKEVTTMAKKQEYDRVGFEEDQNDDEEQEESDDEDEEPQPARNKAAVQKAMSQAAKPAAPQQPKQLTPMEIKALVEHHLNSAYFYLGKL